MMSSLVDMIRQRRNRETLYSTEAYWNSKAEAYEDTAVSMWPNRVLNRLYENEARQLISRLLGDPSGAVLLDLGCGTGRFSRWFAAQGARVTGMDFSAGTLAVAKRQSMGDNPTYHQESVYGLTDENAYDVVFIWGVLTVACRDESQLLDVLRRIRRALHPGGRLLITEPIHRGFLHRVLEMDLTSFLAVLQKAGFQVKATAPLHFWPMRVALCYVSWPAWLTVPLCHLGQAMMKVPGLSRLGDYWAILAYPNGAEFDQASESGHPERLNQATRDYKQQ